MKSIITAILITTLCGLTYATVLHPRTELTVPGRIQYLHTADLNSDSLPDILIMHYEPDDLALHAKRHFSLFINERGEFADKPTVTYNANHREIVADWADIDADGILEILFLKEDGVYQWEWDQGEQTAERIVETASLFRGPDWNRLIRWRFALDINHDGFAELLIPDADRIQIHTQDLLGSYHHLNTLWTPVRHQVIPGAEAHTRTLLPRFEQKDINGDGNNDLLLISEDRLDIFLCSDLLMSGSTALIPPDFRYRFTTTTVDQNLLEQFAPVQTAIDLRDMDQDGYADLILSRASRAGFTSALSQVQIYGNRNGRLNPLPDHVLIAENFDGAHWVHDLNNDSRTDAALLQFPIGIMGAAKYLFTRRMKYSIDLYMQTEEGGFQDKPTQTIHCSRDSKLRNILRPAVIAFADWNGDDRTDLLISTGEQMLTCHYGLPDGIMDKKPSERVKVEVSNRYETLDFNRDDIADMILWRMGRTPDKSQCTLLISKRETD